MQKRRGTRPANGKARNPRPQSVEVPAAQTAVEHASVLAARQPIGAAIVVDGDGVLAGVGEGDLGALGGGGVMRCVIPASFALRAMALRGDEDSFRFPRRLGKLEGCAEPFAHPSLLIGVLDEKLIADE